jgi:hypothetical protein
VVSRASVLTVSCMVCVCAKCSVFECVSWIARADECGVSGLRVWRGAQDCETFRTHRTTVLACFVRVRVVRRLFASFLACF